jgi:hypothetical protein
MSRDGAIIFSDLIGKLAAQAMRRWIFKAREVAQVV